jgi:hypothetical protein
MCGSRTQVIRSLLHPVSDLATAEEAYTAPDIEAKPAEVTAVAETVKDGAPDGNLWRPLAPMKGSVRHSEVVRNG